MMPVTREFVAGYEQARNTGDHCKPASAFGCAVSSLVKACTRTGAATLNSYDSAGALTTHYTAAAKVSSDFISELFCGGEWALRLRA